MRLLLLDIWSMKTNGNIIEMRTPITCSLLVILLGLLSSFAPVSPQQYKHGISLTDSRVADNDRSGRSIAIVIPSDTQERIGNFVIRDGEVISGEPSLQNKLIKTKVPDGTRHSEGTRELCNTLTSIINTNYLYHE